MTFSTGQPAARARRRGLTLAELMVAVAVLSIIMVTFASILAQANRVVSTGQRTMRANAAAASLDQAIRKDFRRMSHNGFLRITGHEGEQRLYFVAAGPSRSVNGGGAGTASVIGYGICDNPLGDQVLWRAQWVLRRDDAETANFQQLSSDVPDVLQGDLADIQRMSETGMRDFIDSEIEPLYPRSLTVPPQTLGQMDDLWMVMRENVEEVEFAYTTGSRDGSGNLEWQEGARTWTRHDLDDWPKAVRIRIRMTEGILPEGTAPPTYEFILPVRRAARGLEEPEDADGWWQN